MAFNPQYIDVENLNPNIGIGISIPFNGSNVFTSTYNTNEAVKNNLINYFLTNPGELPLNPTFGGGLRAFLFEQSTNNTNQSIKNFINNKLQNVFPMITSTNLSILTPKETPNSLSIKLYYSLNNSTTVNNLTFNF